MKVSHQDLATSTRHQDRLAGGVGLSRVSLIVPASPVSESPVTTHRRPLTGPARRARGRMLEPLRFRLGPSAFGWRPGTSPQPWPAGRSRNMAMSASAEPGEAMDAALRLAACGGQAPVRRPG
jgi:hypothetical protein